MIGRRTDRPIDKLAVLKDIPKRLHKRELIDWSFYCYRYELTVCKENFTLFLCASSFVRRRHWLQFTVQPYCVVRYDVPASLWKVVGIVGHKRGRSNL